MASRSTDAALRRARLLALRDAVRELRENPLDALAWSQARRAAFQLGAQLTVSAEVQPGVHHVWDVADVDWDPLHRMPVLVLVDGNGFANSYLGKGMRPGVRWEVARG